MHPTQCLFGVNSLDFLGYHVPDKGILPLFQKVIAIKAFPSPTTVRKLQQLLGLLNFLSQIPHSPVKHIGPSLRTHLQSKENAAVDSSRSRGFRLFQRRMITSATNHAFSSTVVSISASSSAVGAVLQQEVSGMLLPINFFWMLTLADTYYSMFHRELSACYEVIRQFCPLEKERLHGVHWSQVPGLHSFPSLQYTPSSSATPLLHLGFHS